MTYGELLKHPSLVIPPLRKSLTSKAVDTRSNGALVSQIAGDAPLVLGCSAANEGGVENQPILWSVSSRLQCPGVREHVTAHYTLKHC